VDFQWLADALTVGKLEKLIRFRTDRMPNYANPQRRYGTVLRRDGVINVADLPAAPQFIDYAYQNWRLSERSSIRHAY